MPSLTCKLAFGWIALFVWGSLSLSAQNPLSDASSKMEGIVVEQVVPGSSGHKAGIKEGDVLLHWSRGEMSGEIASPFDLEQIEVEQEPRGAVTLEGFRGAKKQVWVMGADVWKVTVRPQLPESILSIYDKARALETAGKTTEAVKHMRTAAILARTDPRPWLSSWFLLQAAQLSVRKQQWDDADRAFADGLQSAEQSSVQVKALLLYSWAESYKKRSDWANAQRYYEESIAESQKLSDESLIIARSINYLGNITMTQGDFSRAEMYYQRALAIRKKLAPGSLPVASTLNNLGNIANRRGDYSQAEEFYKQSLELKRKLAPDSVDLALTLNNLGALAEFGGDLAKAEDYQRKALEIRQHLQPGGLDVAMSWNNLGNIAEKRGDSVQAGAYYRKALEIQRKLNPGSMELAGNYNNLGVITSEQGYLADAEKYFKEALEIEQKLAPGSLNISATLNNLGEIAWRRGDVAGAKDRYQQALKIKESVAPGSSDVAETLHNLGEIAHKQNHLAEAEGYYRQALTITEKVVPDSGVYAQSLASLASILNARQQPDAAVPLYEKALDVLENQTARLGGSQEVRASFRASHEDYYREYIDLLVAQKRPDHAFEVLERSRARGLLENLTAGHVDIHSGVDAALLTKERSLRKEVAVKYAVRSRLLGGNEKEADARIATTNGEIQALVAQYDEVEGEIRSSSPVYASLTQPKPLSAREVQEQLLDSNTMLLEYSLEEERSYVFAVTRNAVQVYELPKQAEIEAAARRVYDLLTAPNHRLKGESYAQRETRVAEAQSRYWSAASRLSRIVLGPIASLFDPLKTGSPTRLVIVSDGALHYIPFGALPLPYRPSAPLITRYEVINLPSASVMEILRREAAGRKSPSGEIAVLADPVFDRQDARVQNDVQIQPTGTNEQIAADRGVHEEGDSGSGLLADSLTRSESDLAILRLPRLPNTRTEAKKILTAIPAGKGKAWLDFDASRANATSGLLAQYRIVHFATHGLMDNKHPELSGLVLSLVDKNGNPENGFLSLQDIYNLNLPADLVVLSACESGLGKNIQSEGLVGLTRAFMYAGATRVVSSLWRIDDRATAELMTKFYHSMEIEHMRPAAALRAAQIAMWRQQQWTAPYYWAAFELQGEWQ